MILALFWQGKLKLVDDAYAMELLITDNFVIVETKRELLITDNFCSGWNKVNDYTHYV